MDPTSVRKGMEPSIRSFLLPELKLAYPAAVSPFIFFFLGIGESEEKPAVHHNPYFKWNSYMASELSKCMGHSS